MRTLWIVIIAAVIAAGGWAGGAQAQNAPKTPPPAQTGVTAGGTESGIAVFQDHCMGCHGNPNVPRAPLPAVIRQMSPERIYEALTTGVMKAQGAGLTDEQKRMAATFLSGRPLGSAKLGDAKDMPNHCAANPPLADPSSQPAWNGWGVDLANTRFQPSASAGLAPEDVSRLKLKWAFGYPDGLSAFGQPAIVSGRVFVGTDIGYIYSLDAQTGCIYWSYETKGSVRTAITVAPVHGRGHAKYAAYFGDAHANAYALDAQTGRLLWMTKVASHFVARVTGAPKVYAGRVYVPVSSSEEFQGSSLDYPCCTSRGSMVALDAKTGRKIWKTYVVGTPRPTRKNSRGVQQYAPAGGSVWNSPTIDVRRHAIYFGTGDGETEPAPGTTDAIMALDLKSGKVLWVFQSQAGDAFLGGCSGPTRTDNCPSVNGPDQDIGNSPILRTMPGGKRVLVFGTKNGRVFALDPDRKGALVWKTSVAPPPGPGQNAFYAALNGVVWGGAADDANVYYGLAAGGMVAVDLASGHKVWYMPFSKPGTHIANSAAASAIPGVSFVGGADGILRGVSTADGHVLWSYDTARKFETVNQVPAHGGAISAAEHVVVVGTQYVTADGRVLWSADTARKFETVNQVPAHGGAISAAGPVIVNGMLYIGSGYGVTGNNSGNVLLAFSAR